MGTASDRLLTLRIDFWNEKYKLDKDQIHLLDQPFTMEEVKSVVFSCDPKKAPVLDEFSFLFYQSCWEIIKEDVMKLVYAFYHNILDISKFNMTCICLITKKSDAKLITQYRPISLINYLK
jgi:hypothetical protein